ncbi:MAG: twin-arginine translocation signal domain-containing protein, partial [Verrucomicrobia bacterium]|nr:twin-arginine translocation signal domain-containing protein [Verrucomicrobiota bacterium]
MMRDHPTMSRGRLPRRDLLKAAAAAGAVAAISADAAPSAQPEGPTMAHVCDIGSRRELFVDRFLIDRLDKATLKLHEPVSGGVAIKLDKTWEGPANFGHVVLRHGGQYLMYYRAMTLEKDDDSGAYCVATSADGVTWTKPN